MRKLFLFFVSPKKLLCLKFKVAADRHSGFLKNAAIRERIEQFSQNLTHTQAENYFYSGVVSTFALLKIQDGG
jgi:hypothetical protein